MSPGTSIASRRHSIADDRGQTMAEYGVVLSVITLATVSVFTALSGGVTETVQRALELLPG